MQYTFNEGRRHKIPTQYTGDELAGTGRGAGKAPKSDGVVYPGSRGGMAGAGYRKAGR